MATIAAQAEASISTQRPLDGVDLLPYLSGQNSTTPHEQLCWRWYAKEIFAVRRGASKLIVTQMDDWQLFDLETDAERIRQPRRPATANG